uniref:Uncharacterized protein n=1 Tax=Arundo donax TaxID=35708 RepID=A0A0A9AMI2_ARUDO
MPPPTPANPCCKLGISPVVS